MERNSETKLRWFGYGVQNISRRMMRLELPSRRPGRRPKRRFMDAVTEDMKLVGVRKKEADDRVRWRQMIHCGDP